MKIGDIVKRKITCEAQNQEYDGKVIYMNEHYYTLEFTFPHGKIREAYANKGMVDESVEDNG